MVRNKIQTIHSLKADVRSLLRYGKKNARKGKDIASALSFKNDRLVRIAIRELIADGLPVSSSVTPPLGYFIASSLDEANDYMKALKGRLVNDAYRRRDFKVAARSILQPGQLGLL